MILGIVAAFVVVPLLERGEESLAPAWIARERGEPCPLLSLERGGEATPLPSSPEERRVLLLAFLATEGGEPCPLCLHRQREEERALLSAFLARDPCLPR